MKAMTDQRRDVAMLACLGECKPIDAFGEDRKENRLKTWLLKRHRRHRCLNKFEFRTTTYAKDDGRFLAAMMNDGKVKVLDAGKWKMTYACKRFDAATRVADE